MNSIHQKKLIPISPKRKSRIFEPVGRDRIHVYVDETHEGDIFMFGSLFVCTGFPYEDMDEAVRSLCISERIQELKHNRKGLNSAYFREFMESNKYGSIRFDIHAVHMQRYRAMRSAYLILGKNYDRIAHAHSAAIAEIFPDIHDRVIKLVKSKNQLADIMDILAPYCKDQASNDLIDKIRSTDFDAFSARDVHKSHINYTTFLEVVSDSMVHASHGVHEIQIIADEYPKTQSLLDDLSKKIVLYSDGRSTPLRLEFVKSERNGGVQICDVVLRECAKSIPKAMEGVTRRKFAFRKGVHPIASQPFIADTSSLRRSS